MYQDREEGLYHPAFLYDDFFFNYISSCVEHLKFEHAAENCHRISIFTVPWYNKRIVCCISCFYMLTRSKVICRIVGSSLPDLKVRSTIDGAVP